jgi:hypothetical protein
MLGHCDYPGLFRRFRFDTRNARVRQVDPLR